ncbi:MAG: NADH-quinone oxidoreductase subunit N [Bacteroidetes bacterium]|nr:NADH-quinone oxidoreductase subunit N [Bacteroidota bacterium]MBV6460371.1 NADH-quinone oxidoreductase subunit N [Flavobacteriales bacterium]WKZ74739.1 MAG: NADH-quinone oxidoreductase subunit N [Vicingaceae bacterium]MCL4815761.1 NADH-quinone oxidoreductase subunit N [Flavobacteriales bacterium]NOG95793.1 NADH-quinone oxidoreductase subunit N [Bacteroidota bacterium]
MNITDFLLMRHELLLTAMVLIMLLIQIFTSNDYNASYFAMALFFIITVFGFAPSEKGEIFGNMYITDSLRVLMKNILNIGVLIVLFQSGEWISKPHNEGKRYEFYLILISTLIGMNFMISAGDFLMFYLGLEIASIPLAALAAYDKYRTKSSEAGIKMILSAAFSSAVMLFGISLLYGTCGTLYFSEISPQINGNILQILAFVFFISGLAFKISLVPFHFWTPDVYEGAPTTVTSYYSVISKGAAVFIFIILLFTVFKNLISQWQPIIYMLAVLTMSIGNLFALRQQNLKRFLAFSSIAQAGFILLGIIGAEQTGMASVVYFVLIYIFSNLAAFGVVSVVSEKTSKEAIEDYNGFYRTNPKLSLVLMLGLFSLAGIPPVAGFFGKFFLFSSVASAGYYWLLFIAAINATVSLYYYLLPVKAMFINKNDTPIEYIQSNPTAKTALIICVVGLLLTGFAGVLFDYITSLSFGI